MIDAYEIGIQLLLQEDVSAGLAVINRGLADVDRAISATSANLASLGQEAERVAKALTVAVGAKLPQAAAAVTGSPSPVAEAPARTEKGAAVIDPGSTAGPLVTRDVGTAASPAKAATSEERTERQSPSTPSGVGQALDAGSPKKAVTSEIAAPSRRDAAPLDRLDQGGAADRETKVIASPENPRPRNDREAASAEAEPSQQPTAPRTKLDVTAAIKTTREPAVSSPARSGQVRAQLADRFQSERGRVPSAPWSVSDRGAQQATSARLAERAAAPQMPGRDRAEGGVGTVMLDGRLVGQWLSEHMGREASRPPSGTSFFDARQTPAWNVSGAL